MSLPNHLRVEGALAEIIELLTNYEDPSVISYENLFKYPDVEALLYRLLVKHMSQKERQIIEDAIQEAEYVAFIDEDDAQHMELLAQTHYLLPIQRNLRYLDNEFLNNYNYYILEGSDTRLPELAQTAKDQNSIRYWIESCKRTSDTLTLSEFLDLYFTVNELKDICREHQIKGFSKGPKQHVIQLVADAFFESPFSFIEGYSKAAYQLLAYFILEDRNSVSKELVGDLNTDFWLVEIHRLQTIYLMPADTLEPIKAYFEAHQMNPFDYIRPEDKVLFQDQASTFENETAETSSTETVSPEEEALDWEDKIARLLEQEENHTPEFDLFLDLLNAYGVVPYSLATTLYNCFFNEDKTENEVKALVKSHLKDILIGDTNQFIHPMIPEEYPDILSHFEDINYFEPKSYDELLAMGDYDTLSTNKATRNAIKFFTKLFKDDDMREIYTDALIIQQLARHTEPSQLDQILEHLAEEPEIRRFNKLEAKRHLKKLAMHVPLWKLHGHSQAELDR
ncbi:hypothetical protein ACY2DA_01725 [Staphylococcus simulans]